MTPSQWQLQERESFSIDPKAHPACPSRSSPAAELYTSKTSALRLPMALTSGLAWISSPPKSVLRRPRAQVPLGSFDDSNGGESVAAYSVVSLSPYLSPSPSPSTPPPRPLSQVARHLLHHHRPAPHAPAFVPRRLGLSRPGRLGGRGGGGRGGVPHVQVPLCRPGRWVMSPPFPCRPGRCVMSPPLPL